MRAKNIGIILFELYGKSIMLVSLINVLICLINAEFSFILN